MPVFPLVGSTRVVSPGRIRPSRSAASIMASATRSFTDPPGLRYSHFPQTAACVLGDPHTLRILVTGVRPMRSRILPTHAGLCNAEVIGVSALDHVVCSTATMCFSGLAEELIEAQVPNRSLKLVID